MSCYSFSLFVLHSQARYPNLDYSFIENSTFTQKVPPSFATPYPNYREDPTASFMLLKRPSQPPSSHLHMNHRAGPVVTAATKSRDSR